MDQNFIRNFAIIAHVDHGKSTLADRFLELTQTVPKERMRPQYLDQMPLEREKGVTIKLAPVTMIWHPKNYQDSEYILNLIDTPGHVDFSYEVSRSLNAVEGVILLVDVSKGIQAQTIANLRLALEQKLAVLPVLNKIDLPNIDLELRKRELAELLKISEDEILLISAKKGLNVDKVLEKIIEKIPPPKGNPEMPLKALIFDSFYSEHKGIVFYLRIFDGKVKEGDELQILGSKTKIRAEEVGIFKPELKRTGILTTGSIGYLITRVKDIKKYRVGETITSLNNPNPSPIPGYREIKPMIFSSLYLKDLKEANKLGIALEKLRLNDPSLIFEPERSVALGLGYRCGFLGLFHLEIVKERLKREYDLEVIVTKPSVIYRVWLNKNNYQEIYSPQKFPTGKIEKVEEPIAEVEIVTPSVYLGNILELIKKYRGKILEQKYLTSFFGKFTSLIIKAKIPLALLIVDFYDKLKNVSAGFASMNYKVVGYEKTDVVRLDILIAGERKEEFSTIVYRQDAYNEAKKITKFLKENLPRQLFEVKIQAVLNWQKGGGKIIASERLPAMRKDVTAKLYGGDVTRKIKLLEKQKRGKKELLRFGKVNVPSDIYLKMLKSKI
jgi:GTP-binding protein LepA